jgi:hypothetical protein
MTERRYRIDERPGAGPLGRHVQHDERSKAFRVPVTGYTPTSKVWARHAGPFDQGQLGSCTGNAIAGLAMTDPFYDHHRRLRQAQAVRCYSRATTFDEWDGTYPPDDTGSSGLAACKAAVSLFWTKAYRWGFGIDDVLRHLSTSGPMAVGTLWLAGMDEPDAKGIVRATGGVRGGHEYELVGVHFDTTLKAPGSSLVEAQQSWGRSWGVRGTDHVLGRFFIPFEDLGTLLARDGDAVTFAAS